MSRRSRFLPIVVSIALVMFASGSGCSNAPSALATGPDPGPDRSTNGAIAIDESALIGSAGGSKLTIEIPIQSLGKAESGALNVSIRDIDGYPTHASTRVEYDVAAGGTQKQSVTFEMPPGISQQADWVLKNLRIDDGSVGGLRLTTSLLRVIPPYELVLRGPQNLQQGKPATYRIEARHALTRAPLPGVDVALTLKSGDQTVQTLTGKTGPLGEAVLSIQIATAGNYTVLASTSQNGTSDELEGPIAVAEPGRKVLLSSDKPIYQPGQTIHLRALALVPPDNTPLAGEPVTFEVEDGKGNKIFERDITSDTYGIASAKLEIGRIVNLGHFKTRAIVGGVATEKTVEVSRYALPKFRVVMGADKTWYQPGETLTGTLDAGYFFGKPVGGADVVLEGVTLDIGETVFQKVVGKTDAQGKMAFSLALPQSLVGLPLEQGNALISLRAEVTDTAGQKVEKEHAVTVAESAVRVVAVPEATSLVPGIENEIALFVSDPLGAPIANAAAKVEVDGKTLNATTDAWGQASVSWVPGSAGANGVVTITPPGGAPVAQPFAFASQAGSEHVLVRTDKSVYDIGETVKIQVLASAGETHAYVDWIHQGQTVDMRTLELDGSGAASFTMPIDKSLTGTSRIEAYVADDDGNVVRAGRTVFARTGSSLSVTMSTDKPVYTPGEPAKLTFSVKDETGKPAVAALGVQVVDEAVFAVMDAKPGLLETYFELEDAYSEPKYEIQPPPGSITDLLFQKTKADDPEEALAAQKQTAATLAALGSAPLVGLDLSSFAGVVTQASTLLSPYYETERKRLLQALVPIAMSVVSDLEARGCRAKDYYCQSLGAGFPDLFGERLRGQLLAYDFWGNAYTDESMPYAWSLSFRTQGPDEQPNTGDDRVLEITFDELGAFGVPGSGSGAGGSWSGTGGSGGSAGSAGGAGTGGSGGGAGGAEEGPRVRSDFPETLYVNPKIITGPDGKATVDVDMADSITEWRVSALAHSAAGKLGGGQSGIQVFQDFFADVSFPATLTRGDEVTFPIAVYNYLATPENVVLKLAPAPWYTPLGATEQTVNVGPNEVVGVAFPVRVENVGLQTLTVTALGGKASDAVARKVLVVPDGKEFSSAISGSLPAGSVSHSVSFPANVVPGSRELYVEVYPAYLAQAVSGMESMLQVPNGCFEQTTSTAWPNVLVTSYMQKTGQITPEIELEAESLMSAGYQRLLTFEHPGGGFSWFGTQDPAPFLSVTAFGLMEFADMAKVHVVDDAMIARTQAWLAAQQKTDGSWPGDQSEFFSFHTSVLRNTAFVVWALAESGYAGSEIAKGLAFVQSQLGTDDDPYTLAIVANAHAAAAPSSPALADVLAKLDAKKQVDADTVFWDTDGTQTSFYGGGNDARVATTALVAYALIRTGTQKSNVDGALELLIGSKDSMGNFGSTQATIWTLRTLLLSAEKGTEGAVGTLDVSMDGASFATVPLTQGQSDVMTTVDLGTLATASSHQVSLAFIGTGKVSYNIVARHHIPWAQVPPEPAGPLSVSISYDKTTLAVNDMAQATLSVVNNTASVQNMVIVTAGLPPGFAVQTEDLDAYKASGQLSTYELTGKQLTLYLTALDPNATAVFQYRLLATMPVKASDGGASAYLYYEPEKKTAAPPTVLDVGG